MTPRYTYREPIVRTIVDETKSTPKLTKNQRKAKRKRRRK